MKSAPPGFWALGSVYLLLLGLGLWSSQVGDPAEGQFRLRDIEADIRMVESVILAAPGEADLSEAREQLPELAKAADELARAEDTPPFIVEQAATLVLIFGKTGEGAGPKGREDVAELLPAEDSRSALGRILAALIAGETPADDDRMALAESGMSSWLRSRLLVYIDDPTTLPEPTSPHAAREKEFAGHYSLVFMWFAIAGITGLIILISLPFRWNSLPGQGLRAEMSSPWRAEWWSGWYALFFWTALQGATMFVVGFALHSLEVGRPWTSLVSLVVQVGAGVLTLVFVGRHVTQAPRSLRGVIADLRAGLGPFDGRVMPALGWTLGGYAVAVPVVLGAGLIQLILPIPEQVVTNPVLVEVAGAENSLSQLAIMLSAVVAAPIFEEAIFRGVLFRHLRTRIGVRAAVVVTAFTFSIMHPSLSTLVPLFALGVVLALVTERSGSVLPAMLLHSLWNGVQLILTMVRYGG